MNQKNNPFQPSEFVTFGGVTFGRATEAYASTVKNRWTRQETTAYAKGMPLFNGNPADFDAYIGLLLREIGEDGIIALATGGRATGSYTNDAGETVTYDIPGGSFIGGESLMGAEGQTELSTVMYQAQSWDRTSSTAWAI